MPITSRTFWLKFMEQKFRENGKCELSESVLLKFRDLCWVFQSSSMKVEVMGNERALLGFLLAKIHKLDPDVIVVSLVLYFIFVQVFSMIFLLMKSLCILFKEV